MGYLENSFSVKSHKANSRFMEDTIAAWIQDFPDFSKDECTDLETILNRNGGIGLYNIIVTLQSIAKEEEEEKESVERTEVQKDERYSELIEKYSQEFYDGIIKPALEYSKSVTPKHLKYKAFVEKIFEGYTEKMSTIKKRKLTVLGTYEFVTSGEWGDGTHYYMGNQIFISNVMKDMLRQKKVEYIQWRDG